MNIYPAAGIWLHFACLGIQKKLSVAGFVYDRECVRTVTFQKDLRKNLLVFYVV